MALTLTPQSDDGLCFYGDIQDEVNAYDGGLTVATNNGHSADLKWGNDGFYWANVKGFAEITAVHPDKWNALETDDSVEWLTITEGDDIKIFVSDALEEKLEKLTDAASVILVEDLTETDDVLAATIKWLFIKGKLIL